MGKLFKNTAWFFLICAVILGISTPLFLLTDQASWLNRVYSFLIIMFPLIIISGFYYGLSIIIDILTRIESKM